MKRRQHNICLRSTKRVKEEGGIEVKEPLGDSEGEVSNSRRVTEESREDEGEVSNSRKVTEESREDEGAVNKTKPFVEKDSEGTSGIKESSSSQVVHKVSK